MWPPGGFCEYKRVFSGSRPERESERSLFGYRSGLSSLWGIPTHCEIISVGDWRVGFSWEDCTHKGLLTTSSFKLANLSHTDWLQLKVCFQTHFESDIIPECVQMKFVFLSHVWCTEEQSPLTTVYCIFWLTEVGCTQRVSGFKRIVRIYWRWNLIREDFMEQKPVGFAKHVFPKLNYHEAAH